MGPSFGTLNRVIGNSLGDIKRRIFAADIVGAHFAFRDDAGDGGFETRGHFGFLEPVEHQFGGHSIAIGFRCEMFLRTGLLVLKKKC